jgi:hypothetical protein
MTTTPTVDNKYSSHNVKHDYGITNNALLQKRTLNTVTLTQSPTMTNYKPIILR